MKRTVALLFAFALLLVIVAPMSFGVNTQSVNVWSHPAIWADDGTPVPPFPDMTNSTTNLWADDGSPVPPFPNSLWADDGSPVPPFPNSLWADDGSPVPPFPNNI